MDTNTFQTEVITIGFQLMLYVVGSYIQIKIISTCMREKDKVWQITITNSISMMILFSFAMIFQTIFRHVPFVSQYTGEWICFLAAFIYLYAGCMIGLHSFAVSLVKYVFIVHQDRAFNFGEEKLKNVFFVVNLLHSLLLNLPAVIFYDFESLNSVTECLGLRDKVLEHYNTSDHPVIDRMLFCKLNDGYNEDADPQLSYILKQSFCATRMLWYWLFCSNIPEGVLYHYIFRKMRRYGMNKSSCAHIQSDSNFLIPKLDRY